MSPNKEKLMVGQMQLFQIYATQGANKFVNKSHNEPRKNKYHEDMIMTNGQDKKGVGRMPWH